MKIKELMPMLKVHGRTVYDEEKEALFCNWTCSGFTIGVEGTYLKVKITALSDQMDGFMGFPAPPPDWPCIGGVVDGELINRLECCAEEEWVTLWESDEKKRQEVRFLRVSEAARGKAGVMEIETDGTFFRPEETKRKTIEIIGDSISCGMGNEGPDSTILFHSTEENGWLSYGALAAQEMGYEFRIIAESGICALRSNYPIDEKRGMDKVYRYTDETYDRRRGIEPEEWDFKANPNDIVLINLGTNDSNAIRFYEDIDTVEEMEKHFHAGYKRFVQMVRELNGPDTWILCALGPMDYYNYHDIKEVVNELVEETGDQRLKCFEFVQISMLKEGFGAGGHPSVKTHARMAKELIYHIRKYTGE